MLNYPPPSGTPQPEADSTASEADPTEPGAAEPDEPVRLGIRHVTGALVRTPTAAQIAGGLNSSSPNDAARAAQIAKSSDAQIAAEPANSVPIRIRRVQMRRVKSRSNTS